MIDGFLGGVRTFPCLNTTRFWIPPFACMSLVDEGGASSCKIVDSSLVWLVGPQSGESAKPACLTAFNTDQWIKPNGYGVCTFDHPARSLANQSIEGFASGLEEESGYFIKQAGVSSEDDRKRAKWAVVGMTDKPEGDWATADLKKQTKDKVSRVAMVSPVDLTSGDEEFSWWYTQIGALPSTSPAGARNLRPYLDESEFVSDGGSGVNEWRSGSMAYLSNTVDSPSDLVSMELCPIQSMWAAPGDSSSRLNKVATFKRRMQIMATASFAVCAFQVAGIDTPPPRGTRLSVAFERYSASGLLEEYVEGVRYTTSEDDSGALSYDLPENVSVSWIFNVDPGDWIALVNRSQLSITPHYVESVNRPYSSAYLRGVTILPE